MDVTNVSHDQAEIDAKIIEFVGTLFQLASNFRVRGEMILDRRPGFRCQAWVESLFEVAAGYGCFKGVPFDALRPCITKSIVALICLADDLLEVTFYESCLWQARQRIIDQPERTREDEWRLKRLRQVRLKFANQKQAYLKLAYGKAKIPKEIKRALDITAIKQSDQLQREILQTLEGMPMVLQFYPRNEPADLASLSRLRSKYRQFFTESEESDSSASDH